jgi:hypothetical protein
VFSFNPASITLATGQQQTVVVRASGNRTLTDTTFSIRFDPSSVAVVAVRPILANGGMADTHMEPGLVTFSIPTALNLSGSQDVGEILLQGIAAGTSTLSFEKAPAGAGSIPAAVEVR